MSISRRECIRLGGLAAVAGGLGACQHAQQTATGEAQGREGHEASDQGKGQAALDGPPVDELEAAEASFRRLAKMRPSAAAHEGHADVLSRLGRDEEARAALARARALEASPRATQ